MLLWRVWFIRTWTRRGILSKGHLWCSFAREVFSLPVFFALFLCVLEVKHLRVFKWIGLEFFNWIQSELKIKFMRESFLGYSSVSFVILCLLHFHEGTILTVSYRVAMTIKHPVLISLVHYLMYFIFSKLLCNGCKLGLRCGRSAVQLHDGALNLERARIFIWALDLVDLAALSLEIKHLWGVAKIRFPVAS